MHRVLVVDDQQIVCYSLQRFFQSKGFEVSVATKGEEALQKVEIESPDVVVMDVRMPGMDGIEVLKKIKEKYPKIQVIMMTAYSTTERAIEAIKLGAFDYLTKPFENEELLYRVRDAIKTKELMKEVIFLDRSEDYTGSERIIGKSPKMISICKQIGKVAPTDAPVLIRGESGTGKELIARAIYHYSNRANKPFLAINCAAIPQELLEAELFGYEKGAFTGASLRRLGKFEQCDGGTIFLDEVGDLPLSLQGKLLRVLQEGTFYRLGGNEEIKVNVRVIAATNKDLESLIRKNLFREDLYYRLSVVTLYLPPLRERKEDIKELVYYFIHKYNQKFGKKIKGITAEALEKLEEYPWPGNVRELENTIQRAMVFCHTDYLSLENFEPLLQDIHLYKKCTSFDEIVKTLVDYVFKEGYYERFHEMISKIEKSIIKKALELTKGNQVQAANLLKISRNTLRKKLEEEI